MYSAATCSDWSPEDRDRKVYRKQPCPFCESQTVEEFFDGESLACSTCNNEWVSQDETL